MADRYVLALVGVVALVCAVAIFSVLPHQSAILPTTPSLPLRLDPTDSLVGSAYADIGEIPPNYAPPWNVFDEVGFLFIDVAENGGEVELTVAADHPDMAFYKTFYVYQNDSESPWKGVNFTGDDDLGPYFLGEASKNLTLNATTLDEENWLLIYACADDDGEWRCGCYSEHDQACGLWSIEEFFLEDPNICVTDPASCEGFACTGPVPGNASLCTGDATGLSADTARTLLASCSSPPGSAPKCQYTCATNYHLSAGSCVPNQYTCTGTIPLNATLCANDDQDLTANVPNQLVTACTPGVKCEFTCNGDLEKSGSSCVAQTLPVTCIGSQQICSTTPPGNSSADTAYNCGSDLDCYVCDENYHKQGSHCVADTICLGTDLICINATHLNNANYKTSRFCAEETGTQCYSCKEGYVREGDSCVPHSWSTCSGDRLVCGSFVTRGIWVGPLDCNLDPGGCHQCILGYAPSGSNCVIHPAQNVRIVDIQRSTNTDNFGVMTNTIYTTFCKELPGMVYANLEVKNTGSVGGPTYGFSSDQDSIPLCTDPDVASKGIHYEYNYFFGSNTASGTKSLTATIGGFSFSDSDNADNTMTKNIVVD